MKKQLSIIAVSLVAIFVSVGYVSQTEPAKKTSVELVAERICEPAVNPEGKEYKKGTQGEMRYLIRMQECTSKWERSLRSDPVFLAKEKAAYGL